jgi:hypothetical protein
MLIGIWDKTLAIKTCFLSAQCYIEKDIDGIKAILLTKYPPKTVRSSPLPILKEPSSKTHPLISRGPSRKESQKPLV